MIGNAVHVMRIATGEIEDDAPTEPRALPAPIRLTGAEGQGHSTLAPASVSASAERKSAIVTAWTRRTAMVVRVRQSR